MGEQGDQRDHGVGVQGDQGGQGIKEQWVGRAREGTWGKRVGEQEGIGIERGRV